MDVSNAFNNPTSGKIDQQRKILEELERQKKSLSKSGSSSSSSLGMPPALNTSEGSAQRLPPALEAANKTSLGYFIHQESAFGNVILPVIPRIPKPQK